jgi:hypothetical protein
MSAEGGYVPVCRVCNTPVFGRHDARDCAMAAVCQDLEECLRMLWLLDEETLLGLTVDPHGFVRDAHESLRQARRFLASGDSD